MIHRKTKHEFRVRVPITNPVTSLDIENMRQWCLTTFGPGGRNPKYRWRFGWVRRSEDTFYFRFEKDALFFVLRWT